MDGGALLNFNGQPLRLPLPSYRLTGQVMLYWSKIPLTNSWGGLPLPLVQRVNVKLISPSGRTYDIEAQANTTRLCFLT
ncbi:MAG UNVERIFIED_CONTAM: hypothetical protein LVT10_16550 [Anaerolineae bacterium]